MKFTVMIVLLIPVVGARHHHRALLETILKRNLFTKVGNDVQNVMNNVFDLLNLDSNFLANSRVKLLLTMHYDLQSISEKNFDAYGKMKDAAKPDTGNKTTNTIELFDLIEEILNNKPSNLSDTIIETKKRCKHTKEKSQINDTSEAMSDFGDSKEFMQFIHDFIQKVDNLSEKDFTKPPLFSTDEQSDYDQNYIESNLRIWQPPGVLELDYFNDTNSRRIFRGQKSRVKSYPFMVSIHLMGTFTCAGCLISKDLVISAASCLQLLYNNRFYRENPRSLYVRVGSDYFIKGGETIDVIETYFHPTYNPKTLANNLVILRLQRIIKFKRKQERIRRILIDNHASHLPDNTNGIIVVGWGPNRETHIINQFTRMLVSQLDIYHIDECAEIYSRIYVTNKHFCAGFISTGGGACNKDLGGPGIVGGKLVGIISFGAPICGAVDSPTVFTKLGFYTDWIEGIMNLEPPTMGQQTTLHSFKSRAPFFYPLPPKVLIKPVITTETKPGVELEDPDIITLKSVLSDLAHSNKSFLSGILYGDYEYPDDFNIYDMFKPTRKLDPMQHPLVNKSIFLIPGIHEIPTEPTAYVTIPLTTATTKLPSPFPEPTATTIPPSRTASTTEEHFTDIITDTDLLRTGTNRYNKQSNNVVESDDDSIIYYESSEDTTKISTTPMAKSTKLSPHRHHHQHGHHHKKRARARTNEYTSHYYNDEFSARAAREYEENDYFGLKITD